MKNILFGVVIPVLVLASGVGAFMAMDAKELSTNSSGGDDLPALLQAMPRADVAQVRALGETLRLTASGTVVPYREIQMAAEVGGRIVEKSSELRSGNYVEKGELLYKIDPRDYQLTVERLTRKQEQELAELAELEQDIENAERLLEVAEQEMQLAAAEVERVASIGKSFSSQAELDQARRAQLTSMNQKVTIQNQISSLKSKRRRMELEAKLAGTELEQAKVDLGRTIITAPVSGKIVSEEVEEDSYVQRGTPLLTIEDTEKVEVACNLRMDQLYWILDRERLSADKLVNAAQASRYDLPKVPVEIDYELAGRESLTYTWSGVLDRYDGAGLDPQSRTVPVRILVNNPRQFSVNGKPVDEADLSGPPALVRGMFVDATFNLQPATKLLLIPKLSVKPATNSSVIWKFKPDDRALEVIAQRKESESSGSDGEAGDADAQRSGEGMAEKVELDPDDWAAGFVRVVDHVQIIAPYRDDTPSGESPEQSVEEGGTGWEGPEYLICEVDGGSLKPGDAVVVSPLPGFRGDGENPVRVKRSQL